MHACIIGDSSCSSQLDNSRIMEWNQSTLVESVTSNVGLWNLYKLIDTRFASLSRLPRVVEEFGACASFLRVRKPCRASMSACDFFGELLGPSKATPM